MAPKTRAPKAARRETPASPAEPTAAPPAAAVVEREAALSVDPDNDPGPRTFREYFARCGRNGMATIDDICSVAEQFGLSELPKGHARPKQVV